MNIKQLLCGAVLAGAAVAASAQVTLTNDRGAFDASGSFAYNSNFDDFGADFAFPGPGFTRGDVTYPSLDNLTVGAGTYSIGSVKTVMSYNYWSPLVATINTAPRYTMLGFDAAVTSGLVSITVTTNVGAYSFNNLTMGDGAPTFTFEGFKTASAGEYFTGFRIETLGQGYLPGITNVEVGVSAVPEPETYAMLLAGLAMMGAVARRRQA